jgi:hypothetical protein
MFPKGADQAAAVLQLARLAGCRCDPDVVIDQRPDRHGVKHVRVAHDDGCPLLARLERRN